VSVNYSLKVHTTDCVANVQVQKSLRRVLNSYDFHSIHVEFYMTKISFLTAFFSVCVRALKTPWMLPFGAIFNRFCAVFMWARKKARWLH